jgi:MerR family transcriptional regulator, light-induced transcriptional regulator
MTEATPRTLTIAAVERETRLSKDVLRVWEKRYGFPTPLRDANGERIYLVEHVERLGLLKRCLGRGHRPGYLMGLSDQELSALAGRSLQEGVTDAERALFDTLLAPIHAHDPVAFERLLRQQLARQGLAAFVESTIARLTTEVGWRWEIGVFAVFEEHLYTEVVSRVLRQAIATIPAGAQPPSILLSTLPGEEHGLGLLMAEALFALEGASCVALGTNLPLLDLSRASQAYGADVVALSVSAAYPKAGPGLRQLRSLLPGDTQLWAGGAGSAASGETEAVWRLMTLADCRTAVAEWRATH